MKETRFDDLGFRLGTGLFGVVIIALVVGIGAVLYLDGSMAIHKFGWQFWQTEVWNPVSGEFGARAFIWGTLYSAVLALLIALGSRYVPLGPARDVTVPVAEPAAEEPEPVAA